MRIRKFCFFTAVSSNAVILSLLERARAILPIEYVDDIYV